MNLDDLIRLSLEKAAEKTDMTNEQKVEILLKSLTEFLNKQTDSKN